MEMGDVHATGGLVEMDERGTGVRSGSAADAAIADKGIYPYSVVELRTLDRALSTTTNMDMKDTVSTAEWMQLWRLSDLKLLKSIALQPGAVCDRFRSGDRKARDRHTIQGPGKRSPGHRDDRPDLAARFHRYGSTTRYRLLALNR